LVSFQGLVISDQLHAAVVDGSTAGISTSSLFREVFIRLNASGSAGIARRLPSL
jgi:hypothetical protein